MFLAAVVVVAVGGLGREREGEVGVANTGLDSLRLISVRVG